MALKENYPSAGRFVNTSQFAKGIADFNQRRRTNAQNELNAENTRIFNERRLDQADEAAEALAVQRAAVNEQNRINAENSNQASLRSSSLARDKFNYDKGAPARLQAALAAERQRVKDENIARYDLINNGAESSRIFGRDDLGKVNALGDAPGPLTMEDEQFIDNMNSNPQLFQNLKLIEQQTRKRLEQSGASPEQVEQGVAYATRNFTAQSPESIKLQLDASNSLAATQNKILTGGSGSSGSVSGRGSIGRGLREGIAEYDFMEKVFEKMDADIESSWYEDLGNFINPLNNRDVTEANISKLMGIGKAQGVKGPAMLQAMKSTGFMNDGEYKGLDADELADPENKQELDNLLTVATQLQSAHEKSAGAGQEDRLSMAEKVYDKNVARNNKIFSQGIRRSTTPTEIQSLYSNYVGSGAIDTSGPAEEPITVPDQTTQASAALSAPSAESVIEKALSAGTQDFVSSDLANPTPIRVFGGVSQDAIAQGRALEEQSSINRLRDKQENAPSTILSQASGEEKKSLLAVIKKRRDDLKNVDDRSVQQESNFRQLNRMIKEDAQREKDAARIREYDLKNK